jgi:hypothetical protein
MRLWLRCALVLSSLAGVACNPPPPPPPTDAGPRDVGMTDTLPDAFVDAPREDAEVPDAPRPDAGMLVGCNSPIPEIVEIAADPRMRDQRVGLAAADASWGVTWVQNIGGFDEIHVATIGNTGDAVVRQHTSLFATQREPAIVSTGGGWLLAWVGNQLGNFEIFTQAVGGDLSPVGTPTRLTTSLDADRTPSLVALPTGTNVLAAWVNVAGKTDSLAMTRVLASTGVPSGAARMVTMMDSSVEAPTLAYRSAGAVLGWGDGARVPPAAMVLALDAVGGGSGTAAPVSSEGNTDGSVDLTMDAFGGAMVFGALVAGVRPEIRVRLLDETGTPVESERVATPSTGRDASIAAFAGGYVVAYRSTGALSTIRIAFLDAQGDFLSETDLATAETAGGRTTVRVTNEGRILVTWADTTATTTRIRAVRVRCE